MGTLYIDRKDLHIRLDGNALAFYTEGSREGSVPLVPLKRVVIVGNVTVDTPVLHRLAGQDISVLFLSGKRLQFSGMLHGRLHNNALLRVRQYEQSRLPFSCRVARELVLRKLQAQSALLEEVRNERPDLRLQLTTALNTLHGMPGSIGGAEGIDSLRGLEGGAAASYFAAYTEIFPESLNFKKRTRRPPADPVNAMLSLCYTMLHYEMVREIEVIGLDPSIGFYHQFDYGRESLACDLVEPYRPAVDRFVWNLFRERTFTVRDFASEDERPGFYLKKAGRKSFYVLYEEWAEQYRPKWVEEVRNLARRIMDGQDALSD